MGINSARRTVGFGSREMRQTTVPSAHRARPGQSADRTNAPSSTNAENAGRVASNKATSQSYQSQFHRHDASSM